MQGSASRAFFWIIGVTSNILRHVMLSKCDHETASLNEKLVIMDCDEDLTFILILKLHFK